MTQRVLILEDQPFQRGFLANLFGNRAGVQVDACEDVDAAIALCACQPYDLVVSDLLMPGQDGIQFIQALAAQPRPPRLAVVSAAPRRMMTSARLMAESLGLDVIGLLPKPVAAADVDTLFEALAQARPSLDASSMQATVRPEPDARELRQAMADGSLTAWFQPKKSLQSGRVVAAEALVRWRHPVLGTLAAGSFLPAMCRHGLEGELLRMMLTASIKAQARWRRQGFRVPVSINLPPHLLEQSDLPDELLALTLALGGTPGELCFELMENSTTRHVSDFYAGACRLRMKGFGLAQDDFGQGLSSVHNLVNTPFTEVKIDRALVSGCARDPALHLTLSTIIALANQLGLTIVAEGVESDADLAVLRRLGCSQVQGFLISQALPSDEFTRLLDDDAPHADETPRAVLR
ncbi:MULTISPECIES: EAL domain-containing response regulator [Stenotrophomonas]|uniref:Response regulator receiver modulated diguanylate phosphodiesterase n=1 Tax=Stenotrophomonas maltophilia (strain R551-3) TaxID=391008 RepID=B4SKU4_STRM5|nr:EAL domain-containing response regulator [Stenotrophomonas maltophilia]ACF50442.1 response regulator receiver modulated diguanylate phosphodiesterase [Stenotrophomonas maltophilia R551-3]MBH1494414.1 EAL domain-containing response regulator [Stenotrophomonas maltophilia]MBN4963599.1 EAL domain-containing response regulator [Stenotrophomonas maltophilia]OCK49368.1 diguanylate phosphodiesterase [Stenotrophomonas maltophilia]PJL06037.1 diguanylate phosphodiesterase [Stenotrophomonas maltophili